jgi:hypothetical protein
MEVSSLLVLGVFMSSYQLAQMGIYWHFIGTCQFLLGVHFPFKALVVGSSPTQPNFLKSRDELEARSPLSPTSVAAMPGLVPAPLPLFSPDKWPSASSAGFRGQVLFFHALHGVQALSHSGRRVSTRAPIAWRRL